MNAYVSLVITMILGRILYAGVLAVAIYGFGLSTYGSSVIQSLVVGLPGIILQLALVPVMAKAIKKGAKLEQ